MLLLENRSALEWSLQFSKSLSRNTCSSSAYAFFLTRPAAAAAKSLKLCPTLCDPIDCSPPGSPVPGILQARTLEWVAISFSNAWKWKVKMKSLSHVRLWVTPWTAAYQAFPSMGFSRQEYWSGVPLPCPPDKTSAPQFYESRSQPGGQSSQESSRDCLLSSFRQMKPEIKVRKVCLSDSCSVVIR